MCFQQRPVPDLANLDSSAPEYKNYMMLRRQVGSREIKPRTYGEIGETIVRWMNSKDEALSDANDQSIVMKIEDKGSSVLLTGDTSFRSWKNIILPFYSEVKRRATFLLAPHHGSLSFFDDPADDNHYYTAHMQKIEPTMTLISVGPNVHGLPDPKAVELYEKYSSGSKKGSKVFTTEDKGNMKLTLKNDGGWNLHTMQ